ncbi:MAG: hypothetical protein ACXIUZ_00575 [Lysobacteraceae bacterium]
MEMPKRIELWKHVYDRDDNAITRALSEMAWNLTAFSCVVEMVRRAPEEDGEKAINGMVMEMVAAGFWTSTMQGVRRLVDAYPLDGDRGVCSLRALVADARKARPHLTRRVFVEDIAGLAYDYERLAKQEHEFLRSHGAGGVDIPPELDPAPSQQRHAMFDWLSGSGPDSRHPEELIRLDVFESLEQRLARFDSLRDHVNVEIAHAGTEFSRSGRVLERWDLTDAKNTLKELVQIAELVGEWFCFSGVGSVLPHPQFDQFAHLDKPLFDQDPQALYAVWDDLANEIGGWHQVRPEDL